MSKHSFNKSSRPLSFSITFNVPNLDLDQFLRKLGMRSNGLRTSPDKDHDIQAGSFHLGSHGEVRLLMKISEEASYCATEYLTIRGEARTNFGRDKIKPFYDAALKVIAEAGGTVAKKQKSFRSPRPRKP